MSEQSHRYATACPVCSTPVSTVTGADGTTYTHALYASDRERQQVYAALVAERAEVVRLRGERDKDRKERIEFRIAVIHARQWAARWKRVATRLQSGINAACEKVYTPDVDAETADDLAEAIMALWTKQESMVTALEYYADQTDDMDERMAEWEHLPGPDTARETLTKCGFVGFATPSATVGGKVEVAE